MKFMHGKKVVDFSSVYGIYDTVNALIVVHPFLHAYTLLMYEVHAWKKNGLLFMGLQYKKIFFFTILQFK